MKKSTFSKTKTSRTHPTRPQSLHRCCWRRFCADWANRCWRMQCIRLYYDWMVSFSHSVFISNYVQTFRKTNLHRRFTTFWSNYRVRISFYLRQFANSWPRYAKEIEFSKYICSGRRTFEHKSDERKQSINRIRTKLDMANRSASTTHSTQSSKQYLLQIHYFIQSNIRIVNTETQIKIIHSY